ncbi:serine/threonine protein kinase [Treponema zioleckii]|uniref:serine/threonine protein kinase n=1 Tax=Treponema zioleckii TaxID=331680 RepID=UPI00168B4EB5|nr:serine/threonine-protein kinase [Treponema zioleckii]
MSDEKTVVAAPKKKTAVPASQKAAMRTVVADSTVAAIEKPSARVATKLSIPAASGAAKKLTSGLTATAPKTSAARTVLADSTVVAAPKTSVRTAAKTVPAPAKGSAAASILKTSGTRTHTPAFIGKYPIKKKLAEGGMGAVFIGTHPQLKRDVILKKLKLKARKNSIVLERFKREAEIMMNLQCPYIVNTFDYFVEGSSHYIVEEFVDGISLSDLIEKQVSLGTELSALIFLDACRALQFAHNRKIVHRDIKPANILISKRGEVKLADFGIAGVDKEVNDSSAEFEDEDKTAEEEVQNFSDDDGITKTGSVLGTPAYMAPEQLEDANSVDQRADIYSMGVMFYEMLTGSKPFDAPLKRDGTLNEQAYEKIKKGKYLNPRRLDKSIPRELCRMISKMLRFKREDRYEKIDDVIAILKKYLSHYDAHSIRTHLARAVNETAQVEIPKFERKKQILLMVVLSFVGAVVLVCSSISVWKAGYVHKTILSPWYKPVTITLKLPIATARFRNNLPIMAYFFEDGDDQPEVKGRKRSFIVDESLDSEDSEFSIYTIKPAYFRAGLYRTKILLGSYVFWTSFSVDKEAVNLPVDFSSINKRSVRVLAKAHDIKTGEDLSKKAKFSIYYNGKWQDLKKINTEKLRSQGVYKIRASAKGYAEKEYSMVTDWYQDELYVEIGLESESDVAKNN